MNKKLEKLKNILKKYPGVVVAFSGGVDSSLLLKVARDILKDRVIAVTAQSPLYPETELRIAKRIARLLNVRHLVVHSSELKNKNFRKNPKNRCFYCKIELFTKLLQIAKKFRFKVIEASNSSDLRDFRPGIIAGKKLKIDSPLIEAGLTKEEIRILAKRFRLPNWNKPSMACLASRIPYGEAVSLTALKRISKAEDFLKKKEFTQVRVRDHYPVARIEVLPDEFYAILRNRGRIVKYFKKLGYRYVTLELEGYRTGSMNL
uniref:ATP-dependent sacrificial sulfur transferase LarE n=1 Tax=candidate division WOR-3 bacterium TaxID=2052148 RepID=A0A7C4TBM3_UNCW3